MKKTSVLAFMNAFTQGKSGGDVCFIESIKRISNLNLTIVTSELGKRLCLENAVKGRFLITSHEQEFRYFFWVYLKRTLKAIFLIKRMRPDALYVSSDFFPDVLPALFIKNKNSSVRWLQKIYHLIPKTRWTAYFAQEISLKIIKKTSDIIITDNEVVVEALLKKYFKKNRLVINHPGISLEKIRKIKSTPPIYAGVYLGRLHESKGVFDLIKIWRQFYHISIYEKNKYPSSKLAIIGTGDIGTIKKMKQLIELNQLESYVKFLGHLNDSEVIQTLKQSQVFLFPSREEGFGIAILEALACGQPVVCYDLPQYKVFGGAIMKVSKYDTGQFSKTVLKLISDQNLYTQQKKLGQTIVRNFSWEKYAEVESKLISDLTFKI